MRFIDGIRNSTASFLSTEDKPRLPRVGDHPINYEREAIMPSSPGMDTDEHLWTKFSLKNDMRKARNLPGITQTQMLELAHHFYRGNPLAKRIVEIPAEYAVGDGILYVAEDSQVQDVLDSHWTDLTNRWSLGQFERIRDLGLSGEMCIPVFVNSVNGHVTLGNIDPGMIEVVVEDRENSMQASAVILKKFHGEKTRRAYKIIQTARTSMDSEAFGRLVGLPEDSKQKEQYGFPYMKGDVVEPKLYTTRLKAEWHGSCFFFTVNNPVSANRGWSDLLAGLDFIDAHDQFLFSQIEKGVESANYVMDTTVTGMNEEQLKDYAKKQERWKPGMRMFHNENVENKFMSPDLKMEDVAMLATSLKNHILAGAGMPPIWFAESLVSRASAPEMTEPTFKHIKIRQRYAASAIAYILRYAIDSAILHGRLTQDKRQSEKTRAGIESAAFYLRMPDLSAKDQRMLGITLNNVSNALKSAVEQEFVDAEVAKRIFQQYLDMSGLDAWRNEPKYKRTDREPDERFDPSKAFQRVSEGVKEINADSHTYYIWSDPQLTKGGGTQAGLKIRESQNANRMNGRKEETIESTESIASSTSS